MNITTDGYFSVHKNESNTYLSFKLAILVIIIIIKTQGFHCKIHLKVHRQAHVTTGKAGHIHRISGEKPLRQNVMQDV